MVSEDSDTPRLGGSRSSAPPPPFSSLELAGRRHDLLSCNEGSQMIGAFFLVLTGKVLEIEFGESFVRFPMAGLHDLIH